MNEIYSLETQLKQAMNRHSELLKDCTEMQKMTDDAVRRAKLGRLRSHMDFTSALSDMIKRAQCRYISHNVKSASKAEHKKDI